MREEILKSLYETFELGKRRGPGGITFDYVKNEDVIHRMNTAFSGAWTTEVVDKFVTEDWVVVEVCVRIKDNETGEYHSHVGFGSQPIARFTSGDNLGKPIDPGNAYKGALAKAIVNACTRWGVGLVKDKNALDEEDVTPVETEIPPKQPVQQVASKLPPMVEPSRTLTSSVSPQPAAAPVQQPVTEAPKQPVRIPPMAPKVPSFIAPPSVAPKVVESVTLVKQEQTPPPPVQQVPVFTAPITTQVPAADLPFSANTDMGGISDVQRVALNAIIKMMEARGVSYEELAKEAFQAKGITKPIPPKDTLSYADAVVVIKFGNEKVRKK